MLSLMLSRMPTYPMASDELWSPLKIPLQPAVLYRFRLLTFSGQATAQQPPVQEVRTQVVGRRDRHR